MSFSTEKKYRIFTEQKRFEGKVVVKRLVEPQERKPDCLTNQHQSRTRLRAFRHSLRTNFIDFTNFSRAGSSFPYGLDFNCY